MRRLSSGQYWDRMEHLVRTAPAPEDLYVSIGEADFLQTWLAYVCAEPEPIQIKRIIVKGMADDLIGALIEENALKPGFDERMHANLSKIENTLSSLPTPIPLVRAAWNEFSPFHGYLYGQRLLIADWQRGQDERYHHRTDLFEIFPTDAPQFHQQAQEAFNLDGHLAVQIGRELMIKRAVAAATGELNSLSLRELQVLQLIVEETLSDREISERLCISIRTAEGHVASIIKKLGVRSRTAAATYSLQHDLL